MACSHGTKKEKECNKQPHVLIDFYYQTTQFTWGEFISSILPISGSDHQAKALQWNRPGNSIRCPFQFEAFWLTHPDFNEFVRSTQLKFNPSNGSKMYIFQQKLKNLKGEIKRWNQTTFGNIFQAQAALNQEMKNFQQRIIIEGCSEDLAKQEQNLEAQIIDRAQHEETLWRQKSRVKWLKDGEKHKKKKITEPQCSAK